MSLPAGQGQPSGKRRSEGSVRQLNGTGGEMPFQGAAGSRMQAGGLGGEIPVQRSDDVQGAGHRRGVSHGYGPERRQGAGHRRDPSELRDARRQTAGVVTHAQRPSSDKLQQGSHHQGEGRPLERVPTGVQQHEMRRQMPREASRRPQGEVHGTLVDDANQRR
eukprot:s652_g18.t1